MDLFELLSNCWGFVGTIFLAQGVLRQSDYAISRQVGTDWDWNKELAKAISSQKAEYLVGVILILIAFILHIGSMCEVLPVFVLSATNKASRIGYALFLILIAYFPSFYIAKYYGAKLELRVHKLCEK